MSKRRLMLEQKLNELNIFALRDLARKTGVKTPTSKKKEELIREIVEIMTGKKKPEEQKTKQGRPPKVFGYDFVNVFKDDNISTQTLNQTETIYESQDIKTVAGWLELVNNNSGLLWVNKNFSNEMYFISSEVLKNYNAKNGDRVVAEVCLDEQRKIVKEIFSINDCPIMKLSESRKDYSMIEHLLPFRNLQFEGLQFKGLNLSYGENFYVYGADNNENTKLSIEFLNQCQVENKIYINVSVAEKNKIFLSNINTCEKFLANIIDDEDVVIRMVALAIERAKRIIETGEDVLVVVDDIASIAGLGKMGLNLIKNIVSIAKESSNGSVTVFAVMPNENFSSIEKLADKRFEITNGKFVKKI